MNLHTFVHTKMLQTSPHRRMLDRIVGADVFNFGIRDSAVVFEKWWQLPTCDVTALIDGSG
jgi:hypothetical protein